MAIEIGFLCCYYRIAHHNNCRIESNWKILVYESEPIANIVVASRDSNSIICLEFNSKMYQNSNLHWSLELLRLILNYYKCGSRREVCRVVGTFEKLHFISSARLNIFLVYSTHNIFFCSWSVALQHSLYLPCCQNYNYVCLCFLLLLFLLISIYLLDL